LSKDKIRHFCIEKKEEVEMEGWLPGGALVVGVTAGASCPNNLIEEVIERVFVLRGEMR
jgi:4-hydroxy-3-methylbut-2-enyl diphosphate reductase